MNRRLALAAVLLGAAALAAANTYTVTTTADSGAGSLRQAILDANTNPGADTIHFNIVGGGVQTIALATDLSPITDVVTIDGYTQPGASANTNAADEGTNAVLEIEVNGQTHVCLDVSASNVQIRGLVVNRCSWGIRINSGTGSVIAGNFIGTDPTGGIHLGFTVVGVSLSGGTVGGLNPADRNLMSSDGEDLRITGNATVQGNLIGTDASGTRRPMGVEGGGYAVTISTGATGTFGGTSPAARNVVSGRDAGGGSTAGGILIAGGSMAVQGNFIGTDVTGTRDIPNKDGIVCSVTGFVIGGAGANEGNVISGNRLAGITIGGSGVIILGNLIGTDATGTLPLGNGSRGVFLNANDCVLGGIAPGEGNTIAFNGTFPATQDGVQVGTNKTGNRIRGNRIFGNTARGIDLGNAQDNPHANDPGDGDTGSNALQNYPIVSSVDYGSSTTVHAFLNSTSSTVFDVDFYANPTCDPRAADYAQGEDYVGSTQATTDGSGNATIDVVLPVVLAAGQPVTAIATDPNGNSSEFSQRLILATSDPHGPAAGFANYVITGQLFEAGATATAGGVPLTGVVVNDASHVTATMPALPFGSVNDVVVTDPSGLVGTRNNGFIADFHDVNGLLSPFDNDIFTLVRDEIAVGVGGGYYGTNDNIKRQAMAVFILKAKHGSCYTPPPCAGVFPDVPCSSGFAPWIEAMASEGITGGCGGGNFCPLNPVRRDQMAVFLLKGKHGAAFIPPPCAGIFPDVSCPGTFADWIEELAAEGVTSGCGGGNYCPSANNTRGQMATFMVKAFGLP
jgi:hypothetical protein